jgi:hypothetical protein
MPLAMKKWLSFLVNFLTACILLFSLSGCEKPTDPLVSYSTDIAPILHANCLACHKANGDGYLKSGLSIESYASLLAGTKYGPIIIPGNSLNSSLVILIDGKADPSITMPHGRLQLLSEKHRNIIKRWIDQGAKNN